MLRFKWPNINMWEYENKIEIIDTCSKQFNKNPKAGHCDTRGAWKLSA